MSNTNNTECRLIEQHEIHRSAEIQNNNIAQRKNDLLAERKSILEKQCECMRVLRKNESSDQREKRLVKIRSYKKHVGKGTKDESVEERNSRLEKQCKYMRAYRKNKSSEQRGKELRGCLRKNLQVNMGLKNRFLSYSSILKIYPWEQLKSISFYSNFL